MPWHILFGALAGVFIALGIGLASVSIGFVAFVIPGLLFLWLMYDYINQIAPK